MNSFIIVVILIKENIKSRGNDSSVDAQCQHFERYLFPFIHELFIHSYRWLQNMGTRFHMNGTVPSDNNIQAGSFSYHATIFLSLHDIQW